MVNKPEKRNTPRKAETTLRVAESAALMEFLLKQMPHKNRDNIKTLLRDRQVLVDDEIISQFNHPLRPGQQVTISRFKIPKPKTYRGITVVYEDRDLIVIDKHAGVLSVATDDKETFTAYSMLRDHVKTKNPAGKIFVVHRLDRETSGLMMFAKSAKVQKMLQEAWHSVILERSYAALTEGRIEQPEGVVSSWLRENKAMMVYSSQEPGDGKPAVTRYKTLKTNDRFSLLKVTLESGRKNQIRVHLSDIGHCIVGDKKYGSTQNPIGRVGLHAMILAFRHPVTGKEMRFETPVPRKFLGCFK